MEAADESHPEEPAAPPAEHDAGAPSRRAGGRGARRPRIQARAKRLAERAQDEREHHASVDVAFEMVDRDADAGGEIIAGALAYRLFI